MQNNSVSPSIFDDDIGPQNMHFKLWKSKSQKLNLDAPTLFTFQGFKEKNTNSETSLRYFSVKKDCLFYTKSKGCNVVRGIIEDLNWIGVSFAKCEESNLPLLYFMKVKCNNKSSKIYFNDKSEFKKVIKFFRMNCILNDFHSRYSSLSFISCGSYGKVRDTLD